MIESQIAQNSVKYYWFIERMLTKFADILSTSSRYGKMFKTEPGVQKALSEVYFEIIEFLRKIKATILRGCK